MAISYYSLFVSLKIDFFLSILCPMSDSNLPGRIILAVLAGSILITILAGCGPSLISAETVGRPVVDQLPTFVPVAQLPPTLTSIPTQPPAVPPTLTPWATPTILPTRPTFTPQPTAAPTQPATAIPAALQPQPAATMTYPPLDPDYIGRSIESLTNRNYGTGAFTLIDSGVDRGSYMRYTFAYNSDNGEVVEGFLNVPKEGSRFPVALVLHGYVDPQKYRMIAYTSKYADALVEAGYMTFHPSYRNHPPNGDSDPYNTFRVDYAVDVLHLVAYIQKMSQDPTGPLRRADGDNIHVMGHSMGGGIAQRVMTVRPEAFKAVVLYGSMSGDERRNYVKIQEWAGERFWFKEAGAPQQIIEAVSPLYFIERWQAPVAIHHGSGDTVVPPEWSAELCEILTALRHPVECYDYVNYPHTFYGAAEELFIERMIRFFEAY